MEQRTASAALIALVVLLKEVRMKPLVALMLLGLSTLLTTGCSDSDVAGPDETALRVASGNQSGPNRGSERVKVMTRNVYVGIDLDPVLQAPSPELIPALVAQAFQQLLQTNFPERAIALAEEIHDSRPDLVGLQEISLIRIQSPGDFFIGNPQPASDVLFDYLEILLSALEERGLDYRAVAQVRNFDVELPMLTGLEPLAFDDIRLTDFDVILVEEDVEISNVVALNYLARLVVPVAPGLVIEVPRGFVAVDATVDHQTFRFVNTHLEPAETAPAVQVAQAAQLIAALSDETNPILLVGDFNSAADGSSTPTYGNLINAGFTDIWTRRREGPEPGFTCCHAANLRNAVPTLDRRLDLIFFRGNGSSVLERVRAEVVGDDPSRDRTPSGLWPSDHGGVATRLRVGVPSLVATR